MYKCEIIADSKSPQNHRLTTFKLTYPRIIHAEAKTHRVISGLHDELEILQDVSINSFREGSKNSASSRAIPFNKMVKMVEEDPFIPIAWQKTHKGMQGSEYLTGLDRDQCEFEWLSARDRALEQAQQLTMVGATKQLCNRLLEPFMWHTVLVSATEFENFFELRCPQYKLVTEKEVFKSKKDFIKFYGLESSHSNKSDLEWLKINESQADIHIQAIAELMWDAYNESIPLQLEAGEWHIPNLGHEWDNDKLLEITKGDLSKRTQARIKISTAHNARISYQTLGNNPKIDYEADIRLHDKLLGPPYHASPFEHCAKAMSDEEYFNYFKGYMQSDVRKEKEYLSQFGYCNNFRGFIQYRYLIENSL